MTTRTRMKPADRKAEILEAALVAARKCGFSKFRQIDIAAEANVSYGLVSTYFKTMTQMRRAVMRAAINRKDLAILAQGLGCGDPDARKAPAELKAKAAKLLTL